MWGKIFFGPFDIKVYQKANALGHSFKLTRLRQTVHITKRNQVNGARKNQKNNAPSSLAIKSKSVTGATGLLCLDKISLNSRFSVSTPQLNNDI